MKQTTVNFSIPFIEFEKGKDFTQRESYEKEGLYVVKDQNGAYFFVEVDPKHAQSFCLPFTFIEILNQKMREASLLEKFDERISQINEGVNHLIEKVADCHKSVNRVCDSQFDHKNLLESLVDMVDEVKDKETSPELPKGGYVSENTLVKIIETVRK